MAKEGGVDILPMVITGTLQLLPKSTFIFQSSQKIRLRVLDPIPYETFKDLPEQEVAGLVKDRMEQALQTLRA